MNFDLKLEVGQRVEGIVTSIKNYGVFLSFDGGYTGLLHISEISKDFISNMNSLFSIGDKILVEIKEIDENTKFLKVSTKVLPDDLNPYKEVAHMKKIISYISEINFSKLSKQLPRMIEAELEREKKQ